jgi:hypothetical protein
MRKTQRYKVQLGTTLLILVQHIQAKYKVKGGYTDDLILLTIKGIM